MGRLTRNIWTVGPLVFKKARLHRYERKLLRYDDVFLRVHVIGPWQVMRRGEPVESLEVAASAFKRLITANLWRKPEVCSTSMMWRGLLIDHVRTIYPSRRLKDRVYALHPHDRRRSTMIHGDPTLANLIKFDNGAVRWIDPLYRDYIPNDPAVDVGKFWQSCWGYERALTGGDLEFDHKPAEYVRWGTGVSREEAETWCAVHMARLLRYHTKDVANKFREVLEDHYECRL